MKRKFVIMLFLNCFLLCIYSQQYKYVTASELNIRNGAGKNYSIIGKLNNMDSVYVLSETNGWTKILLDNGQYGFVSSAYLGSNDIVKTNEDLSKQTQMLDKKSIITMYIFVIIIGAMFVFLFFKLPKEQRQKQNNIFLALMSICLGILTLGIFGGIKNWKNDR